MTTTLFSTSHVKFRVFSMYDETTEPLAYTDWLGREKVSTSPRRKYKTAEDLYEEVAKFLTELGETFVTLTGRPVGSYVEGWAQCSLVVWYRE